jgi:hypothetical protein
MRKRRLSRHATAHHIECRSRTPSEMGGVAWPQNFSVLRWWFPLLRVVVTIRIKVTVNRRK